MYFSQWQRGKKKNLCVKPRSGSRDGCQRVWAYSSWLCAHHGGPWALWSPYSSVFDGRTHMGSSWKNLVSCPTHWVKNTNVICPFFEENLPKSRSTMLWESLRKCENCLRWQYTLGEWPQIFHERLINPKALLWLFSTPLVWPLCPSPTSSPITAPWFTHSWNPGLLSVLHHTKLIHTSGPLSLLSPVPGTHSPPFLQE